MRVKAAIGRRLADPDLDTAAISAETGLKPRYLNALFEAVGTSLMRYVWGCRLGNCRRDLLDPRHAKESVQDIAFRWGFSDSAHFSRAFRRRFGCPPAQFRHCGGERPS